MIILLPFLVCLIGLVVYLISVAPKVQEVGRIMFWVGLFVTLLGSKEIIAVVTR